MAGDWLPIDCNIATKPEVLELCDVCGCEPDAVVGRIVQLWLWAAMNAEAGQAKMTPPRMARMFGGDVFFWEAVAQVGWLVIDAEDRTITIPKWDERFGQAAKERALKARRNANYEAEHPRRRRPDGAAPEHPAHERRNIRRSMAVEERRLEEIEIPPPPRESCASEAWETLRTAWNAGPGRPWKPHTPPKGCEAVCDTPGWLEAAQEAIPKLAACRYFKTPVTLPQFMAAGFVDKVLGGAYVDDKPLRASGGPQGGETRPDPSRKRWWRADAGANLSDREYRSWLADQGDEAQRLKAAIAGKLAEAT